MSDTEQRKQDHIDIVLSTAPVISKVDAGFGRVRFAHCALPDLDLDAVDLSTRFLGHALRAPLLISSMTGGPRLAQAINAHLAEAAGHLGIALAVGSQRVALEQGGAYGIDRTLRARAPHVPLFANLGGAQLVAAGGLEAARRAVEMIGADGLIIHLNPLQEAIQPGGDRDWRGVRAAIATLARDGGMPVLVKEVGFGIAPDLARALFDAGVAAVDVAGAGGTNWALVEGARAPGATAAVAAAFADWGIPTADALVAARAACPQGVLIASGGIRDGVDAAKALRLGADLVGQAAGVLAAAVDSTAAVVAHFEVLLAQLRLACFCTGSRDLAALRTAPLLGAP